MHVLSKLDHVREEIGEMFPQASSVRGRSIAALLPCYNGAAAVGDVIHAFRRALPSVQIYVYDNNSTDGTSTVAERAADQFAASPIGAKEMSCGACSRTSTLTYTCSPTAMRPTNPEGANLLRTFSSCTWSESKRRGRPSWRSLSFVLRVGRYVSVRYCMRYNCAEQERRGAMTAIMRGKWRVTARSGARKKSPQLFKDWGPSDTTRSKDRGAACHSAPIWKPILQRTL